MTDPGRYRARAEEDLWRKRDPIPRLAKTLVAEKIASEEQLRALDREIEELCEAAVRFAEESPDPPLSELTEHVFTERYPSDPHA
jgi:TPP-dependent pyruvate/acetoin dehydrogenase alpha subunit